MRNKIQLDGKKSCEKSNVNISLNKNDDICSDKESADERNDSLDVTLKNENEIADNGGINEDADINSIRNRSPILAVSSSCVSNSSEIVFHDAQEPPEKDKNTTVVPAISLVDTIDHLQETQGTLLLNDDGDKISDRSLDVEMEISPPEIPCSSPHEAVNIDYSNSGNDDKKLSQSDVSETIEVDSKSDVLKQSTDFIPEITDVSMSEKKSGMEAIVIESKTDCAATKSTLKPTEVDSKLDELKQSTEDFIPEVTDFSKSEKKSGMEVIESKTDCNATKSTPKSTEVEDLKNVSATTNSQTLCTDVVEIGFKTPTKAENEDIDFVAETKVAPKDKSSACTADGMFKVKEDHEKMETDADIDIKVKEEPVVGFSPHRLNRSQSVPPISTVKEDDIIDLTKTKSILQKLAFFVSARQSSNRIIVASEFSARPRSETRLPLRKSCSVPSYNSFNADISLEQNQTQETATSDGDVCLQKKNNFEKAQNAQTPPDTKYPVSDQTPPNVSESGMKIRKSPRISKFEKTSRVSLSEQKVQTQRKAAPKSPLATAKELPASGSGVKKVLNSPSEKPVIERSVNVNSPKGCMDQKREPRRTIMLPSPCFTQTMVRQVSTGFVPKSYLRKSISEISKHDSLDENNLADNKSELVKEKTNSKLLHQSAVDISSHGNNENDSNAENTHDKSENNSIQKADKNVKVDETNVSAKEMPLCPTRVNIPLSKRDSCDVNSSNLSCQNEGSSFLAMTDSTDDCIVSELTCELETEHSGRNSARSISSELSVFQISPFRVSSPLSPLPLSPQTLDDLPTCSSLDLDENNPMATPISGPCIFSKKLTPNSETVCPKPVRASSSQSSVESESGYKVPVKVESLQSAHDSAPSIDSTQKR